MPPRLGKGKSTSVRVVVTEDFLKRLDEWRRSQLDVPNRSEALRRMAEWVLAADVKPSRGKPSK
jgi:metal-responsive CopG/Arc/MetJ family transcriptional regulator